MWKIYKLNHLKKIIRPVSFYHKYNCEPCKYHKNYKNNYNKHLKSSKHFSLTQLDNYNKEESTEKNEQDNSVDVINNISDITSCQCVYGVTDEEMLTENYKIEEKNHLVEKLTINYGIYV